MVLTDERAKLVSTYPERFPSRGSGTLIQKTSLPLINCSLLKVKPYIIISYCSCCCVGLIATYAAGAVLKVTVCHLC